MKIKLLTIILAFSFLAISACSDNDDPLKPADYSPLIVGEWEGTAVAAGDTLFFHMNLDGKENKVTGTSLFRVNSNEDSQLSVTGDISYPTVSLAYKSETHDFTFQGNFQATNSDFLDGTLQNEKYGAIPITFAKKK
jgi:hypothetical protein